ERVLRELRPERRTTEVVGTAEVGVRPAQPTVIRETVDTLSSRRWELTPRFKRPDQLQVLLDAIQRTDKHAEISKLSYVASVCSGMSYRRSDMLDEKLDKPPEGVEDVRLVRVR